MGRPRKYGDRATFTTRVDPAVRERLERHAGREGVNPHVERAIVEYLDRHERRKRSERLRGLPR